ncbi:MAG: hypothetical protein QG663_310 [Thermodesulfobacteriota bacterium]|nr:hypothetical protein [Thermodesulfobacteriota bacterium]
MSFDNERDSVAGSKSLTVFRRVEFTDLTKLELLDEAIILKSESINPNSNAISPNPVMSDETGLNSPDKTIERVKSRRQVAPSWFEDAGVMAMDTMTPVPLIPMSIGLFALILAALWVGA